MPHAVISEWRQNIMETLTESAESIYLKEDYVNEWGAEKLDKIIIAALVASLDATCPGNKAIGYAVLVTGAVAGHKNASDFAKWLVGIIIQIMGKREDFPRSLVKRRDSIQPPRLKVSDNKISEFTITALKQMRREELDEEFTKWMKQIA